MDEKTKAARQSKLRERIRNNKQRAAEGAEASAARREEARKRAADCEASHKAKLKASKGN